MKRYVISSLALLLLSGVSLASSVYDYEYPIKNPLLATVIGTPIEFQAVLPKKIRRSVKSIVVFPDRVQPPFTPSKKMPFTLVSQKKKAAPLIFNIAGTGASHASPKMQMMEKAFYQAGFHVVSLPSPTYFSFIMRASTQQVPGHIVQDSADLYRVMELIYEQIRDKVEVTEFYLTGYSLGGAQAAFVAKLDEERKLFNFKKVLMINPPVSLFNSVSILDKMLEDNIPGGPENFDAFFNDIMNRFSETYSHLDQVNFNDDFLYNIYKEGPQNPTEEELARVAALIGLSFRISSSNMIFMSDLATNDGYILPKNHVLTTTQTTTGYFKVAARISFTDYFNERFYPYFSARERGLTRDELENELSLTSIANYLATADKISVVHNEDDIILQPGEIDFFRTTFQSRAHIYPHGGHCGNMSYKDNVSYMINYFAN